MAGIGLLHAVVDNLLRNLDPVAVKELSLGSELEGLAKTISRIQHLLVEAEEKQDLSRYLIEELKEGLYLADDCVDELATLKLSKKARRISKRVRLFFSKSNPLVSTYKISHQVKEIREKLDSFVFGAKFSSSDVYAPIKARGRGTSSYVYEADVIGREADFNAIVNMLLDSDGNDCRVLSIVGMGGMGKTTLAQLVYNDKRVRDAFSLMLWVCISDVGSDFYLEFVNKTLEVATGRVSRGFTTLDEGVAQQLREILAGNRYLLVLDDVWCENVNEFDKLRELLMVGTRGSRILITTRSTKTARTARSDEYYMLPGLTDEDSWHLFERFAFGFEQKVSPVFSHIGRKIVKRCCNVPLAIRVVGSALYGQDERRWQFLLENGLANIPEGDNDLISILKFSYFSLPSPLKSCFSYCALFPKGFEIDKEMLIRLWMAQGFIVGEDFGEEYFSILLKRCFFQDVKMGENGEFVSCKIHDLIHDLALEVAGDEICVVNPWQPNLPAKARHVFHVGKGCENLTFPKRKIHSYVQDGLEKQIPVSMLVENWVFLRVLDLHKLEIKSLPASIGKLLHLRYLDLSFNSVLTKLPDSLAKLHNLQTLDLRWCFMLKELPKDLSNLVKLRHLDISGCGLTHMPSRMDKLTCLLVLTEFVVAEGNSFGNKGVGQLQDLKGLLNLRGSIDILIPENAEIAENDREGGYLKSMGHLKRTHVQFRGHYSADKYDSKGMHETWLERLQPHSHLKVLELVGYQGTKIPWRQIEDNWVSYLPNLVKIILDSCQWLHQLPSLRNLCHLKSLVLRNLTSLEYVENASSIISVTASGLGSGSVVSELTFYPSLEYLDIQGLSELKGWWSEERLFDDQLVDWQPSFPCLSKLVIKSCPSLTFFPLCPRVEKLYLRKVNEKLQFGDGEADAGSCLWEVKLDNMSHLKSLPTAGIARVHINGAEELECLAEVGEVFRSCSALRSLKIENCPKLRHLSGGLEHLSVLESLSICHNCELTFSEEDDDKNGKFWISLQQNLRVLELKELKHMTDLPCGMQYLTALQKLTIDNCGLKTLPIWISSLSSLLSLHIISCYDLKSLPELRELTSLNQFEIMDCPLVPMMSRAEWEDSPKIKHIPNLSLYD